MHTKIQNTDDLVRFSKTIFWEDSSVLQMFCTHEKQDYFPEDINYSGYAYHNIHMLLQICSNEFTHLELVLIDCKYLSGDFLSNPYINGYVDSNGTIHSIDYKNIEKITASGMIYRFMNPKSMDNINYFGNADIIKYSKSENTNGYFLYEVKENNYTMVVIDENKKYKITMVQNSNTIELTLDENKKNELVEFLRRINI